MPTYQFALQQTFRNQEVRNVLNYFSSNPNILNLQCEVDFFRSAWTAAGWTPILANDWQMTGAIVRDLAVGGPGTSYLFTGGPLVGGTASVPGTANQIAALISTQAISATAPTRGRIYLAGVANASMGDDGLWDAGAVIAGQALADSLVVPAFACADPMNLRIVRLIAGGLFGQDNPVASVIFRNNPATIRRRRLGVGA